MEERCLSASDFGFHNSLLQADGSVRFVDFEYAGWDDPSKLICDFCNQPDVLLDSSLSVIFRRAVIHHNPRPEALQKRFSALEPLYQIKWSCICLNDFLKAGQARHQFTQGQLVDQLNLRDHQDGPAQGKIPELAGQDVQPPTGARMSPSGDHGDLCGVTRRLNQLEKARKMVQRASGKYL